MEGHLTLEHFGYTVPMLDPVSLSIGPKPVGRPWEPYRIMPIQVTGTIKSVQVDPSRPWGRREVRKGGNHLDTVRGCRGGSAFGGRYVQGIQQLLSGRPNLLDLQQEPTY